jgi:hypothetical protein
MPMKVDNYTFKSRLLPLLRQLEQAQADDAVAESKIKKLGGAGCALVVAALIGIFVCLSFIESGTTALVFLIPGLLVVAGIVFFVKMGKLMKYDLDNRKVECAVGLLRMLRADTPVQSDVELDLDLREYAEGGKLVDDRTEAGEVKVHRYQHPWLSLRGALADGTRYQLGVVETIHKKEKRKRKGRVKTKERTSGAVQLQLRPKPGKYGEQEAILAALQQAPPQAPLSLKGVRAAGPRIVASFATGQHVKITARRGSGEQGEENIVKVDALLSALLWAYDGLGRSAKGS